jgi:NAD(P)-dependent dehydrogenase (short-subunit alcohol dehydrogenase family)
MFKYDDNDKPIALITGSSKGLGLALANFLAAQGYRLILNARSQDKLEAAGRSIGIKNSNLQMVAGDVALPECRRRLAEAVRPFGRLDLLINNASTLGPLPMPQLANYPIDELRHVFEVNTIAPLALVSEMRPFLSAVGGVVVSLSSDATVGGYAGWGGYGASKAGKAFLNEALKEVS